MKYIETRKTSHNEIVEIYEAIVKSKQEAKDIRERLSEEYECVVEMSKHDNIGFDCNTGREYQKNGSRYIFNVYINRMRVNYEKWSS